MARNQKELSIKPVHQKKVDLPRLARLLAGIALANSKSTSDASEGSKGVEL